MARRHLLALASVIALAAICYWPGLHGVFVFDSSQGIAENRALHATELSFDTLSAAADSYPSGLAVHRQLTMASFALNYYFSGLDPFWFKATNLALHLANGLLVFVFAQALLRIVGTRNQPSLSRNATAWLSVLVAAAWLLHPVNLSAVLHSWQRATLLSGFFVLAGMALFVIGRTWQLEGKRGGLFMVLSALFAFTPLATLAKENGALLPVFLFLIEWIFFHFQAQSTRDRRSIRVFWLLTAGVLLVGGFYFLVRHGWLTGGYDRRAFTLEERVLTECRVLVFYLKSILLPRGAELSLYHDDFALSTSLLTPWSTLPSLVFMASLAAAGIAMRKRAPVLAFGVLFFLVGHSIESSVIALELVHEHRNYIPSVGLLFAACYYLAALGSRLVISSANMRRTTAATAVAASVLVASLAFVTATRARTWGDPVEFASVGVTYHPQSSRWHTELANAYFVMSKASPPSREHFLESSRAEFLEAARLSAYYRAGALLAVIFVDVDLRRPLSPEILEQAAAELRGRPLSSYSVTNMEKLLIRLSKKDTETDPHVAVALLEAIKTNPTLRSRERGKVLAAAVQLAVDKLTIDDATQLAIEALTAYPSEPQHYKNLAIVTLERGDEPVAKEIWAIGEQVAASGAVPDRAEIERLSKLAAR